MTVLGEQPNVNIWILNKECYLNEDGSILHPSDSPFYLLSDHISNPAISLAGSSLVVKFPLQTTILYDLILTIFPVMEHNAVSSLFLLGASGMSFYYRTILETNTWATVTEEFKRQRQNHCSSFRTLTFWRPKKNFLFKGDQRKLRINFSKADSSYWLRRPTVSEKHKRAAHYLTSSEVQKTQA